MQTEVYDTFSDVEDVNLRVWNRTVTACNINEDHGKEDAREYMEQFTRPEQLQMVGMIMLIEQHGKDTVRAQLNRGDINLPDVSEEAANDEG